MFPKVSKLCKRFFQYFDKAEQKIFKSSGLVFFKDFMIRTGFISLLESQIFDNRNLSYTSFSKTELLANMILRVLDGEIRLSHQDNRVNDIFYQQCNESGKVPDSTTCRNFIQKNEYLEPNLNCIFHEQVIAQVKKHKLKKITIDIDLTGKILYGRSEGVRKGYVAGRKNEKCYQINVCYIRELSMIYKIELLPGNTHSSKNLLEKMISICSRLKTKGLKLCFVFDSGYEN